MQQRGLFIREQQSRDRPVRENMRLQNAFWAWERATWIVLAIIVLIALTGVLAHGPLSERTAADGALSVSYDVSTRHLVGAVERQDLGLLRS
jgi:predicted exporter